MAASTASHDSCGHTCLTATGASSSSTAASRRWGRLRKSVAVDSSMDADTSLLTPTTEEVLMGISTSAKQNDGSSPMRPKRSPSALARTNPYAQLPSSEHLRVHAERLEQAAAKASSAAAFRMRMLAARERRRSEEPSPEWEKDPAHFALRNQATIMMTYSELRDWGAELEAPPETSPWACTIEALYAALGCNRGLR